MSDLLASGPDVMLRRFRATDVNAFLSWRGDLEVARFQSWPALPRTAAAAFLEQQAAAPVPDPAGWVQIAVALPGGAPVGDMGLNMASDGQEAEIGISLSRAVWGRGLGRQAVRLAADLIFARSDAARAVLWTDRRNLASQAMIRATGATWIAEERTATEDGELVEDQFILLRPR